MASLDRLPPAETSTPMAVILAAGEGSRLRSARSVGPKPLVHLRGLSIAERSIVQLLAAGVERFVVVLGCDAALVRHEFERVAKRRRCDISFVEAENWEKGNGCSALAAAPLVGDSPFLLTMVDHLLPAEMIRNVLAHPPARDEVALAVDHDTENVFDLPDLTRVEVSGRRIAASSARSRSARSSRSRPPGVTLSAGVGSSVNVTLGERDLLNITRHSAARCSRPPGSSSCRPA